MPHKIKLRVPGSTSNLGAGFDTLGLAIDLWLEVGFQFKTDDTHIDLVQGEGALEIAKVEDHLVLHAFYRACREFQQPLPPVALEIHNNIPLKRGLGSSGAAVVAGLLAAQIYFNNAFSRQDLLNLACQLESHPENASASLLGGLTVNGVDNGHVLCARIAPPKDWGAACFVPDLEIATAAAREVLPLSWSRQQTISNLQSTAMMVAAFAQADPALLAFAAKDYLHQPYRKALIPGFDAIFSAAMNQGSYCVFLSGSGSTLLAICEKHHMLEVSQAMAQAAQAHGLPGRPMALLFAPQGATWEVPPQ